MSERQGRTLKERVRCVIADQSFPVCLDLVKHVVYYAMTSLNWISGIAGQPSPREAVAGRKLDARLDCRERCLEFVQIYVDNKHLSKSVQLARTEDALYLVPVDNGRGTGIFWPFASKIPVTRNHWTVCKITEAAHVLLVRCYKSDSAVYTSPEITPTPPSCRTPYD